MVILATGFLLVNVDRPPGRRIFDRLIPCWDDVKKIAPWERCFDGKTYEIRSNHLLKPIKTISLIQVFR